MQFSVTKYVAIGSLCTIGFVGGFALWSVSVTLSGAVVAWGQVAPMGHNHAIQHPTGGQVASLWVKEGDVVQTGTALLQLDGHAQTVNLDLTERHLFEIMARRARLLAERDDRLSIEFDPVLQTKAAEDPDLQLMLQGQVQLFETHLAYRLQTEKKLHNQTAQMGLEIEGLSAQVQATERQLALLGEELEAQLSLSAKGLADRAQLSTLQQQEAALLGKIAQLRAKRAEAQTQLHELEIDRLRQIAADHKAAITALRDLHPQELRLRADRRRLKQELAGLTLTAPINGVVHGLTISNAQAVVQPAKPILHLVPNDQPFVITAKIVPEEINNLFVGQASIIKLLHKGAARDLKGWLHKISADTFQSRPDSPPYYLVEIALPPRENTSRKGGAPLLRPGMPAQVFIRTHSRSPLDYMLEPIRSYFTQALREY
ncbi:MAG: HlyD family type I secretion periplasmic adaptor subunit [Planktomarina sp.]|uniref:HlyD family type I secretion periplasmic adaptor subunit n=1 Tax=Planktomarina sp. TaxID=2024851 RepID=UPI003C3BE1AA